MPYSAVLPISAICLTFYFVIQATVSPRTKGTVLAVLVTSLFMPHVVPGRQFVVMGLQLFLSIGLLLYFKAQPDRA
jgi:hypothetical protein